MLTAKFTRKELRMLELTQAWSNGLSQAEARRFPATCDKAILNRSHHSKRRPRSWWRLAWLVLV
jgi:hypothetical protein